MNIQDTVTSTNEESKETNEHYDKVSGKPESVNNEVILWGILTIVKSVDIQPWERSNISNCVLLQKLNISKVHTSIVRNVNAVQVIIWL